MMLLSLLAIICLCFVHKCKAQQLQCTLTSDDCKNKYCLMMESFFTCEVYDFGWESICAQYIVGAMFPCPIFPPPDELTDAPSICLPNLISLVSLASPNNTLDLLPGANHSSECFIECYQDYLVNALDFYNSCSGELAALPTGMCPIITNPAMPLASMQTYRAQTCSSNEVNTNCLTDIINNFGADTSGQPDLFDYSCPMPAANYEMLASQFASQLCCFANQNAVLVSMNQVYPPCFMNYMSNAANSPDATYFCVNGTLYDMGTVEVTLNMKFTAGLPNMTNEVSTQTLRGTMMAVTGVTGVNAAQITVLKYSYYSDTGQTVEVPSIVGATSGVFTCLVMIASSENATWSAVAEAMAAPSYGPTICGAYGQDTSLCSAAVIASDYFVASPWDLSAAPVLLPNVWVLCIVAVAVILSTL
mmetsp:Transcript_6824/g.11337  ORF Transcript_6824/g.11337 Transcript_6824/m.11337 type:complete len:418 (-) Transcript_6824:4688-5941(-)